MNAPDRQRVPPEDAGNEKKRLRRGKIFATGGNLKANLNRRSGQYARQREKGHNRGLVWKDAEDLLKLALP